MLDLFEAIEVLDHPVLFRCLELSFDINRNTLTRVSSYLPENPL